MNDNRSSRWGRRVERGAGFQEELSAVLNGADVSERQRAAIAHALTRPSALSSYVDALVDRYTTERERRSGGQPPTNAGRFPRRWTLHLTYLAPDPEEAREQAVVYTEGLTILRPELPAGAALLSRADAWNHVEPVFCGRIGPDDEICMDVTGHPGFHRAAGVNGLSWGDSDGGQ
ncbi:hypothetical protein GCM10011608_24870 [Micromonospora sonchi]|uniref:Uncharacterized protein n=1 Tax=Micromonospora sonchi TaxID=1763543 RepID=A0A917WY02_9ACTN|nr:hypothetical protein [Micromonospora sonchi]GGM39190.1 hypothetical protein GCM10011608_24870 [Micromonospora sonchi]